jgi:hypothetical protein
MNEKPISALEPLTISGRLAVIEAAIRFLAMALPSEEIRVLMQAAVQDMETKLFKEGLPAGSLPLGESLARLEKKPE